jgi:hypothetical protein
LDYKTRLSEILELEKALEVVGDLDIEQELANHHDLLEEYNKNLTASTKSLIVGKLLVNQSK